MARAFAAPVLSERLYAARWCYVFMLPSFGLAILFTFWPIAASWYFSLLDWSGFSDERPYIGLANYVELIGDPYFWQAFGRSFLFMAVTVPVRLTLALIVAIVLNDAALRLAPLFRTLFFLPVVTTSAIVGLLMVFVLSPFNGPVNQALVASVLRQRGHGGLHLPQRLFGSGRNPAARVCLSGGSPVRPDRYAYRADPGEGVALGAPGARRRRIAAVRVSATTSSLTLQRRFAVGWLRGSRLRATITSLILGAICLVWTYPFLWMVSAALKTNVQVASGAGLIPPSPQWGNFERAWTQAHIGQYFTNTVIITVSTVAIVVATTAMMGYALGRYDYPGRKIVLALYAATIFIPEGYTIIPVFDLINRLHLNDTLFGIILAEAGGAHVIFVLLFAGFFSQLPHELEEAAIVDGAGFVRTFARVMLPLSGPVIATTIILQFMSSWNNFMLPLVLTLSRPELRTLGVGMFAFQGQYYSDWSGMAAAATISLLPIIGVFLALQRHFVEGIAGAIKQ